MDQPAIERIAELASRAVSSHRSALQNSVADALTVYSSGTTDDWLAYLQAYGIDPPQTAETMPALMHAGWRRTRAFFSDARFDISGMETMLNPRDPQPQERFPEAELGPEDVGKFLMTARRDAARAFLQTTQFDKRERVRVTIPGSFQSVDFDGQLDGERFQAAMSIEFTLNPDTGQWVLTELRVEGKTEAEDGRTPGVGMML